METTENNTSSLIQQFNAQRAPTFTTEEVKSLVNIVESYKDIILNKSCNARMVKAKHATWKKIAQLYNENTTCKRPVDNLKVKWDNLKKTAKRMSLDVFNENNEVDDISHKIYEWMSNAESSPTEIPPVIKNIMIDQSDDQQSGKSDDEDMSQRKRGSNFSQKESRLLIQCVRAEKNFILCKNTNNKSNLMKNKAWERIAEEFNKQNHRQRTLKMLQNKFCNMRKIVKNASEDYDTNTTSKISPDVKEIKDEPIDTTEVNDADTDVEVEFKEDKNFVLDPLSTLLNGNHGINELDEKVPLENSQVDKLKMELLKYQLETAKLEHQRIKEKLEADRTYSINRSIESAIRIRAARLELVAAEAKLPPNHPALAYTDEEMSAERYKLS